MGIIPVEGSIHLPEENLGSRKGRYGQLYRYKKVTFVPIFYEEEGRFNEKSVKLRPIAVDVNVRVPLNVHLR
ncbi:Uncharacterised protein [uncultured archaeon]|nr:Uncharacterised protein [uncultured archaeon]